MPTPLGIICKIVLVVGLIFTFAPLSPTSAQVSGVWEEIPVGSATNGGISNTPGSGSTNVSLKIAPNGTIYAAWAELCSAVKKLDRKRH